MRRLLLALPALLLAASGLALLCPVPVLAEPIGGHAMLPSGSNNVPVTAENNILQDKVTAGNYPYANITVNAKGVITSIISGSAPADTLFPCQSPPNSLQYNAAGAFECATVDNGLDFTGGVLSLKQLFDDQSGGDYTILTGDGAKTIEVGEHTYTLPQAGTTGFATGWGSGVLNTGSGNATLSTTTSIFKGAGGGTSLTLRPGDAAYPASDGTDYVTLPIFNYIGMSSGLPIIGGGSGAGLATGTRSGNTTQFASVTGSKTSGNLLAWDASGNAVDSGISTISVGGGTVTSVTLSSPGGIFSVSGTNPITTTGTFGYSLSGTSGGVPYFSSGSALSSSGALAANGFVLGGGAGAAPTASQLTGLVLGQGSSAPTALNLTSNAFLTGNGTGSPNAVAITGLVLGAGASAPGAYGGTSCTNQFPRSQSAAGVWTCATVGASDVSLANLTATDTTLTFSGTYNGSTARTVGLNLGNNNAWTKGQAVTPVALTSGATVSVDASLSNDFTLTAAHTFTLANPSNLLAGQTLNFWITQDGTGSRVMTLGSQYQAAGGSSTLVLSTAASTKDLLSCVSDTTSSLTCALLKAIAH